MLQNTTRSGFFRSTLRDKVSMCGSIHGQRLLQMRREQGSQELNDVRLLERLVVPNLSDNRDFGICLFQALFLAHQALEALCHAVACCRTNVIQREPALLTIKEG